MKTGGFVLVAAGVLALCAAERALANSAGVSGRATLGCGGGSCHVGAASSDTTVTISAPASVTPGAGADVTVSITGPAPLLNGINQGGFNLQPSAGTLSVPADGTIRLWAGNTEASHSITGNDQRAWTVRWNPPGVPSLCEFVFNAAGNAVNGDGVQSSADHWNLATASTVVNTQGDERNPTGEFSVPAANRAHVFGSTLQSPTTLVVGPLTLQVIANDDTGIARVEIYDEDLTGETRIGDATFAGVVNGGNRYNLAWSSGLETPGPHTLRAHITDCSGNAIDVTIDLIVL